MTVLDGLSNDMYFWFVATKASVKVQLLQSILGIRERSGLWLKGWTCANILSQKKEEAFWPRVRFKNDYIPVLIIKMCV